MAETNIAQASGKYYLPKTADAYFYINEMLAFTAKANTSANVDIKTTQSELKGGQNNSVIGVVTSEKAIDVSFETPEWKPEFLAANIGTTIRYGSQNFTIGNLTYQADENGKITLDEVPADGKIQVSINNAWLVLAVEGDTAPITLDLSSYGVKSGDCIEAVGVFKRTGKEISLTVDTDPSVGKLVLTSPIFRGTSGEVGTSEYTFPAFALSGNWTQAFSADTKYTVSGKPIAVTGEKCGEGETYGYYREYIKDEAELSIAMIAASPSVIELETGDTQQLSVYGAKNALYEKIELTDGVTYAVDAGTTGITVSTTGLVTAVSACTGAVVTVAYKDFKTTVSVTVTDKS